MLNARWFQGLRIFLVWLIGFVLAMVIMFLWHELLMVFVVNTLHADRYVAPLVHILYYLIAGLIWVMYFLLSKEYLNRFAEKGMLVIGTLRIIGVQLLIIATGQVGMLVYGFLPADRLSILLMAAEGAGGAGMLILAGRLKAVLPGDDAKKNP